MDLDEGKFTHLNALLDQTTIYSKFLSEQMEGLDEEEGLKPAKKKAKTDGGGKGDGSGAALTETQKLLPLMTVDMRDYQLKGVRWLIALYQNGLNGEDDATTKGGGERGGGRRDGE